MSMIYHYSDFDVQYSVASITRSGSTATLTTTTPHNFENSLSVIIEGADQAAYNGTFTVTVVDAYTLTYTVAGTPVTPATGTIIARSGRHYFIGSEPAYQTDPLTSFDIIPALATATAPSSPGPSEIAVYEVETDTWYLTDYLIDTIYYLSPDYLPLTHSVVGPLPDGAVTAIPLADQKTKKITRAYDYLFTNIYKDIDVSGTTYFGDLNNVNLYTLFEKDYSVLSVTPVPIFLPDQTVVTKNQSDLQDIREAWSTRANEAQDYLDTLVTDINAAADQSALDAIDITTGWPV